MEGPSLKSEAVIKYRDQMELRTPVEFNVGHLNVRGAFPIEVQDLYPITMHFPELNSTDILCGAEIWVDESVAQSFPATWPAGEFVKKE